MQGGDDEPLSPVVAGCWTSASDDLVGGVVDHTENDNIVNNYFSILYISHDSKFEGPEYNFRSK